MEVVLEGDLALQLGEEDVGCTVVGNSEAGDDEIVDIGNRVGYPKMD